jgi:glyoxylase-like metal-dependent hydrolase (beta-lactamase superfamily II)
MTGHVTAPAAALAERLPNWVTLVRARNPGPMTLDGTNSWILRAPGATEAVVVDPGPLDEGHLRALAGYGRVGGVLLTHGHPDHAEGLDRFLEIAGTERLIFSSGSPSIELAGTTIRLLTTPGHTADSLCFLAERDGEQVIFTGDTILGRGTTVVAWPDGDLGEYLDSLELLSAYEGIPALPGHGPALADCAAAARFYLAHRRARLDQVRQALAEGASSAADVVARVYADVDSSLWPAAEWSVRAQLAYLNGEDRESATRVGGLDPA